jgi:hypothetical protein
MLYIRGVVGLGRAVYVSLNALLFGRTAWSEFLSLPFPKMNLGSSTFRPNSSPQGLQKSPSIYNPAQPIENHDL